MARALHRVRRALRGPLRWAGALGGGAVWLPALAQELDDMRDLRGDLWSTPHHALQGQAQGGEIVISERLPEPVGAREELQLKGKTGPQVAYRVTT
jgi:hypothetical protein